MRGNIFCCLLFVYSVPLFAQNVGIGISNPFELLTVNGTAVVDASNVHNGTFGGGALLKFGSVGGIGIGSTKQLGSVMRGLDFYTNGQSRFMIDSSGNIGINQVPLSAFKLTLNGSMYSQGGIGIATATPDLITHKLDVNGSARTRFDQYINRDLWVDRNLDVDGTSNLLGNIIAGANMSIAGNITSVDNISVSGNITVDGGRGLIRGTNSTQQVLGFPSGTVGYTNAPAGFTDDVEFAFSGIFSGNPRIAVANVTNQTGTYERWTFTVHSINYATNRFWVRFYNASNTTSTMQVTLNFIAVGPAL